MTKEIKDYLHLYLGCEVFDCYDPDRPKILNIQFYKWIGECIEGGRMKLKLRPLSDMTEEEFIEAGKLHIADGGHITISFKEVANQNKLPIRPSVFPYLLSKHFDLFGLIESGLAIDKTNQGVGIKNNFMEKHEEKGLELIEKFKPLVRTPRFGKRHVDPYYLVKEAAIILCDEMIHLLEGWPIPRDITIQKELRP